MKNTTGSKKYENYADLFYSHFQNEILFNKVDECDAFKEAYFERYGLLRQEEMEKEAIEELGKDGKEPTDTEIQQYIEDNDYYREGAYQYYLVKSEDVIDDSGEVDKYALNITMDAEMEDIFRNEFEGEERYVEGEFVEGTDVYIVPVYHFGTNWRYISSPI